MDMGKWVIWSIEGICIFPLEKLSTLGTYWLPSLLSALFNLVCRHPFFCQQPSPPFLRPSLLKLPLPASSSSSTILPRALLPLGLPSAPGAPPTSWRQLTSSYLKTQSFLPELWFCSWRILLLNDVAIVPRPHIWTSSLSSLFLYSCTPRQSTSGLWIPQSYLLSLRLKLLMETNRNSLKVNHVRGVCCKVTADNSKDPRGMTEASRPAQGLWLKLEI